MTTLSTSIYADATKVDSPGVNLMPPTIFLICLIIGGSLEFFIPSAIPVLWTPLRLTLGLLIAVSGLAFMLAAHQQLQRMGTNVPTNLPATTFVVQGAYALSRNPMYVGGSAFFLGIGLALGSLWLLVAYLPLGLYLSLYVIPREEAYLQRVFGGEYRAYTRRVRRWL
jgi:protein-S-isoprenylcysteine O-methyltransferase Ste14